MKNVRIIITKKGFEQLKAFMEENYLYGYFVNNENELFDENILNNPTILKEIDDNIFFAKDNILEDDEYVLSQTISDLKEKNTSYYILLLDTETGAMKIYKNLSGLVKLPIVNAKVNFDDFEIMKRIEDYNYQELEIEELEM